MRCPACERENPADARFCNACGASLTGADEDAGRPGADQVDAGPESAVSPPAAVPSPVPSPALTAESLRRYLPEALAEKLRALGHLESERRHVTVVFADISGFTAMSEVLDAEEVTQVINGCFQALVGVVFRYEGTIDKFIGDEIMALFGAPLAHENDPERAVRAALEMQARLAEFNQSLATPLPKPLTLHVGINSGEVIAGNVGSDLQMDYSVLGDTVNLAARLEGASPSGQIWVSERTYALTRHLFEYKPLKPLKLQGKQRKVQAFQALGVKAIPERGRGVAEGYGQLVGREAELGQLQALVGEVQAGQGRVLGVVGEAGIDEAEIRRVAVQIGETAHAEQVILFGSYARGQATEDSDVDLLVVAASTVPRFRRSRELYRSLRPYPFSMDLLVYTPDEVERARHSPASFLHHVLVEGKPLYARGA